MQAMAAFKARWLSSDYNSFGHHDGGSRCWRDLFPRRLFKLRS